MVDLRDVNKSECLLSFGVNEDWSFEKDFLKCRKVPLRAFDGSVDATELVARAHTGFKWRRPHRPIILLAAAYRYTRFFRGNSVHEKKFVGFEPGEGFISFKEVMEDTGLADQQSLIFLKCDIEGGEYPLLNQFIEVSASLSGLVIEFHDLNGRIGEIEAFVDAFPLPLIHVHANNFSPLNAAGRPDVIECTFSSSAVPGIVRELPLDLDRANWKSKPDYRIWFENK